MSEVVRPKVGVGVCVIKDGKVLLGRRLNAHGDGTWSFPGGHLELGESFSDCAKREVNEEVGIEIDDPTFITATNDIFESEYKHYVTVYVQAPWRSGEPQTLEPDKMTDWQWFDWDDLPQPLFLPITHLLDTGYNPT